MPDDCYQFYFTVIDEKAIAITNLKSPETNNSTIIFLCLSLLVLLVIGAIFYLLKLKRKRDRNLHQIKIGQFHFNPKSLTLNLEAKTIALSGKEADLLHLLYSNVGETIERDAIFKLVWGNESDYVGRTMDVFISKLRKKLEADPAVKIINIRGVGYKLVID